MEAIRIIFTFVFCWLFLGCLFSFLMEIGQQKNGGKPSREMFIICLFAWPYYLYLIFRQITHNNRENK